MDMPLHCDNHVSMTARTHNAQLPKVDIVFTSYEAAFTDIQVLKTVPWEALVLDDRYKIKSTLHKVHHTLMELPVPYRLMLTSQPPTTFELALQVVNTTCTHT